jgi:hypothetical protein
VVGREIDHFLNGESMNTATDTEVPAGFRLVTKDEFFDALKADRRDIMPSNLQPYITSWKVVSNQQVWGLTRPGWKSPFGTPAQYMLKQP